jgi:hypothetical protein
VDYFVYTLLVIYNHDGPCTSVYCACIHGKIIHLSRLSCYFAYFNLNTKRYICFKITDDAGDLINKRGDNYNDLAL